MLSSRKGGFLCQLPEFLKGYRICFKLAIRNVILISNKLEKKPLDVAYMIKEDIKLYTSAHNNLNDDDLVVLFSVFFSGVVFVVVLFFPPLQGPE